MLKSKFTINMLSLKIIFFSWIKYDSINDSDQWIQVLICKKILMNTLIRNLLVNNMLNWQICLAILLLKVRCLKLQTRHWALAWKESFQGHHLERRVIQLFCVNVLFLFSSHWSTVLSSSDVSDWLSNPRQGIQ